MSISSRVRRTGLSMLEGILAKRHRPAQGAECMLCKRLVDKEYIDQAQELNFLAPDGSWIEVQPQTWFRYVAECRHCQCGARKCEHPFQADVMTIDMGSNEWIVPDALSRARRVGYFDPHQHSHAGISGASDISQEDVVPEGRIISTGRA